MTASFGARHATAWIRPSFAASMLAAFLLVSSTAPRASAADPVVDDTFQRTVTSCWDTADTGARYSCPVASGMSVDGEEGHMTLNRRARARSAILGGVSAVDANVLATVDPGGLPVGRGVLVATLVRKTAAGSYAARIRVSVDGRIHLSAVRTLGSSTRALGPEATLDGLRYRSGDRLAVRTRISGIAPTVIRMRVWLDGADEPSRWQLHRTDRSRLTGAGAIAVVGRLLASDPQLDAAPGDGRTDIRFDRLTVMRVAPPTIDPGPGGPYAAIFQGDASGATDVTNALQRFLEAHDGEHVALASGGVYKVKGVFFTASNLTVDFRGARLVGTKPGTAVLRIQTGDHVVLNDPWVVGTGYGWKPELQDEHGIYVDGGQDITINRPVTRDTRGDGIYIGMFHSGTTPVKGVSITNVDIQRASRSGIAPLAGRVSIVGGHIARVGFHGVNFEPNTDVQARSIDGVVDGIDIRRFGDLPADSGNYAVAALGYSTATKRSVVVRNVTGDRLRMTFGHVAAVTVTNNVSDNATDAFFKDCDAVTFRDNARVTRR